MAFTVHSFSMELHGHDSGIVLYIIAMSRAHLLIQFSLFSLYFLYQYTHLESIRICVSRSQAGGEGQQSV